MLNEWISLQTDTTKCLRFNNYERFCIVSEAATVHLFRNIKIHSYTNKENVFSFEIYLLNQRERSIVNPMNIENVSANL